MPKEALTQGQRAIVKAINRLKTPHSNLHRALLVGLKTAERNQKDIVSRFVQRAEHRLNSEKKLKQDQLAAAQQMLGEARSQLALMEKLHDKQLTQIAKNQLKFAEDNFEIISSAAKARASIIEAQNRIDKSLQHWHDAFITKAVEAIEDDAALKAGLELLTGAGLIVAGTAGGPVTAGVATALSAIVLAKNVTQILNSVSTKDRDRAREERALILIEAVNNLSLRWLQVL